MNAWELEKGREGIDACSVPSYFFDAGPNLLALLACKHGKHSDDCPSQPDNSSNTISLMSAKNCLGVPPNERLVDLKLACRDQLQALERQGYWITQELSSPQCSGTAYGMIKVGLRQAVAVCATSPTGMKFVEPPFKEEDRWRPPFGNRTIPDGMLVLRRYRADYCPPSGSKDLEGMVVFVGPQPTESFVVCNVDPIEGVTQLSKRYDSNCGGQPPNPNAWVACKMVARYRDTNRGKVRTCCSCKPAVVDRRPVPVPRSVFN